MKLPEEEQKKQEYYRDARTGGYYGEIWTTVGKCVFCDLRDKYIFHEENGIVMTVALYAYIDGNFMIIPRRHIKSIKELTPEEWETIRKFMYIAKKIIREVHDTKGLQYILRDGGIVAQSTVSDHLHIHVIPFDAPDLVTWNYRELKYTPLQNAEFYKEKSKEIKDLSKRFHQKYAELPVVSDKKEIFKEAVKQALASRRKSQAKKSAKVGASLILRDRIISMCNTNLVDGPIELEKDGTWVSPPTVSHAEEQCIAHAAKDGMSTKGATMIVTLSPCMACARLIVNSGLGALYYIDDWWDQNALTFLTNNKVKVVKLTAKKDD
jgi:dCMP deaminase